MITSIPILYYTIHITYTYDDHYNPAVARAWQESSTTKRVYEGHMGCYRLVATHVALQTDGIAMIIT